MGINAGRMLPPTAMAVVFETNKSRLELIGVNKADSRIVNGVNSADAECERCQ